MEVILVVMAVENAVADQALAVTEADQVPAVMAAGQALAVTEADQVPVAATMEAMATIMVMMMEMAVDTMIWMTNPNRLFTTH
jgi:uroporphyrinogen-III decarboxylase